MRFPHTRHVAWTLWAIAAIPVLFITPLDWRIDRGAAALFFGLTSALIVVLYPTVGALIASRRPENPFGWLFCIIGLSLTAWQFGNTYVSYSMNVRTLPADAWLGWLSNFGILPAALTLFTFVALLYPSGRLLSRRWRPIVWTAVSVIVASMAYRAIAIKSVGDDIPNPAYISTVARIVQPLEFIGLIIIAVVFVASLLSLGLRFRQSQGIERLQLKWFVYVAVLALSAFILAGIAEVVDPVNQGGFVGSVLWFTGMLGILIGLPSVIGLAILRYRLFDIDRIINKTLVYGVLSVILVSADVLLVLGLEHLLNPIAAGSDLVVAGSTLAVAALVRPLRSRIQTVVDRRFYRRKYDATRTLEAFSSRLRDQTDLSALASELGAVVQETMQPAHVSLWLRNADRTTGNL
jgi:hypothetical protein